MSADASWSARMSARAKARDAARREALEAEREAANRPWAEFVEARGGHSAFLNDDWYAHGHPAHGWGCTVDAATGRILGVACFGVVVEEDAPPPPDVCPVCRDFAAYRE